MSCLLFPPWFILNQAEIIPTDRLSRHLLHIEITTTFVVYMPHTQVCVAAECESCRLQAFCGYFYAVQQLLLQEKKKREFCRPLKREFVHCWLPLYAELWTPPPHMTAFSLSLMMETQADAQQKALRSFVHKHTENTNGRGKRRGRLRESERKMSRLNGW